MMKQFDVFQIAQLLRDFGIAAVCIFFSISNVISVLVGIRKWIQKRLFIRREGKKHKK